MSKGIKFEKPLEPTGIAKHSGTADDLINVVEAGGGDILVKADIIVSIRVRLLVLLLIHVIFYYSLMRKPNLLMQFMLLRSQAI